MLALSPVGGHRAPAVLVARRPDHEVRPAGRGGHADAVARQEVAVDAARLVVRAPLLGAELHRQRGRCRTARDSRPRRQIDDVLPVDDWTDQLVEVGVASVGALGRRGEAEPERRDARARGQRVGGPGQVVTLVEHHQAEPVAQMLHVNVRRVVRRHGQRPHVVFAAADDAHRYAERRRAARRTTAAPDPASGRRPACCGACRRWPGTRPRSCRPPSAARRRRGPGAPARRPAPPSGRAAARGGRARRAPARRSRGRDPRRRRHPGRTHGARPRRRTRARGNRRCAHPRDSRAAPARRAAGRSPRSCRLETATWAEWEE